MSNFQNDFKVAVNNILKDLYSGTDYWGGGDKGNVGIIKPITDNDDPNWSNYNFINTHWTVRDNIVEPFIRQKGFKDNIEKNKSYKDSDSNREYFRLLWLNRDELFSPDSNYADEIVDAINVTRGKGDERESLIGKILNRLPFLDVEIRGAAGSSEDFSGTDAIINFKGKDYTAQIKGFNSYQKGKDTFLINLKLERKYKQDFYVFSKKSGNEYHIMVFWNRRNKITDRGILFPSDDLFLAVNYKMKEKKITYKLKD